MDTFEEDEPVDLAEVSKQLAGLDNVMDITNKNIAAVCKELNINTPF